MAVMLEEPNSKRYLHKKRIHFPKENHSIVSLVQYGRREHILWVEYRVLCFATGNVHVQAVSWS